MDYNYSHLIPLIKKTGSELSPKDFQSAINVIFHDVEAKYYDSLHSGMWNSLQEQVNLLVDDLMASRQFNASTLSLIDVGCGTGLSTQLLMNSKLGQYINHITLLDTSPNMLKQAGTRSKEWNKNVDLVNSSIMGATNKYDIVLVCSVLHHVPDLAQFFKQVDHIQNSGGILIHLNDSNGDYLKDAEYVKRIAEYAAQDKRSLLKRKLVRLIPPGIKHFLNKKFRTEPYIDEVNDILIKEKIIKKRLLAGEIWSVTDIHVEELPYSTQVGISFKFLKECLSNYEPITRRSYGFYGLLKSELTSHFQELESMHIHNKKLNGRLLSAVWIKK